MTAVPDQPAALLRQAAEKLRSAATNATSGPWIVHEAHGFLRVDNNRGHSGADLPEWNRDTAEYIALMHPGVGAALADWLENTAIKLHHSTHPEWQGNVEPHALAVARQVLGVAE